ncbi:MAG: YbjN domain-containing protein [Alphaproteobacteria bacterium]
MIDSRPETIEDETNPLDNVEDILHAHNWTFNRMTDDELVVDVTGKSGNYGLFFIWQEDMGALQLCVQLDLEIRDNNIKTAQKAVFSINENLWMGHFDLPKSNNKPSYRYNCLLRGSQRHNASCLIEDVVDIALAQCERHYPLFTLLTSANDINDQTLSLALMDTQGES